jgi:integrase
MERANRRNQDTSWIFTSNARVTRTGAKRDEPLSPYALTTHLTNMRGARSSGKTYRNQLADLPHFTLHTIRSCMTSWIADHIGEEAGAASKMLDHRTQQERDKADGMSPTTQRFYDVAQRIPAKTRVMRAGSNALIDAYEAAGGREVYPRSVMVNDSVSILPRT